MNRMGLEEQLQQALDHLQACLQASRVAGELPAWTQSIRDAATELRPILRRQIQVIHDDDFAEIVEQDPGLLTRVERLKENDGRLARRFDQLVKGIERLEQLVSQVEPDELQVEPDVSELIVEGLEFVRNVQQQEAAIRSWLLEAFARDRGTVD